MTKDRENQKILHSMNTAVTFRNKHDKSGGMYGQEYLFLLEMALQDTEQLYDAIVYAYSLGYRRGYNKAKKERWEHGKKRAEDKRRWKTPEVLQIQRKAIFCIRS